MGDLPRYVISCLQTGKLAALAILVSSGIVLQVLVSQVLSSYFPIGSDIILFEALGTFHFSVLTCHYLLLQACALYHNWWPMLTGK